MNITNVSYMLDHPLVNLVSDSWNPPTYNLVNCTLIRESQHGAIYSGQKVAIEMNKMCVHEATRVKYYSTMVLCYGWWKSVPTRLETVIYHLFRNCCKIRYVSLHYELCPLEHDHIGLVLFLLVRMCI